MPKLDRIIIAIGAAMSFILSCIIIYGLFLGLEPTKISRETKETEAATKVPAALEAETAKVPTVPESQPTGVYGDLQTICIDGVLYFWVFLDGKKVVLTPKFDVTTKVVPCPVRQ